MTAVIVNAVKIAFTIIYIIILEVITMANPTENETNKKNSNVVIAVTRQFGSLGRPIAREVAKSLGLKFIDREIIEKAAERMGYKIDELEKIDNHRIKGLSRMIYPLGIGNRDLQDKLFEIEKSIILEYATYENCVIVGRCANFILKNRPNVLKVHIYAPYEKRLEMSIDDLHLTKGEAKAMINKVDDARSSYYLYHTGETFDSTAFQDVLINSSMLSFDENVKLLCDIARDRFPVLKENK